MPVTHVDFPGEVTHVSVLDEHGNLDGSLDPGIPAEDLRELYRKMLLVRAFDDRRLRLQRQGRIGTFAPVKGQEAAQLGSAYALRKTDWMVPAFRELAAGVWRGMKLVDDLLYAAGYEEGVDLPEDARDLPIAIPVGSQIPHAVGVAWARKLQGEDDVALVYFGDGASSEGDFHEALNFAAVFQLPVVFVCQNNRWAISVPRSRQTRSRTIAQKAIAYGMPGVQVDGNDLLAVYRVTREAVERARRGDGPTLVEALTYRLSVHTTADDPTKYRSAEELAEWEKKDPLPRLRGYMLAKGIMTEDDEKPWLDEVEDSIRAAVREFDAREHADPLVMFDHVLAERPPHLERQRDELAAHVRHAGTPDVRPEDLKGTSEDVGGGVGVPDPERIGRSGGD